MSRNLSDDKFFEQLAAQIELASSKPASSRLKARIYSTLLARQAESGPLMNLVDTKAGGGHLCIFEELVRIAPIGSAAKRLNICRVCHARIVAERVEHAPIYWPGCPYVDFQK